MLRTMNRRLTQATTRTRRSVRTPATTLLAQDEIVRGSESKIRYRVGRLLGFGGSGQVYLARRLDHASSIPEVLCIKASPIMDGWLREAYFGQLLQGHPRAIQIFDRFVRMRDDGRPLYGLAGADGTAGDRGDPGSARQAPSR